MDGSFGRTLDALERVFALTDRFFRAENVDVRHRPALDLAIEEIFTNMVRHRAGCREIRLRLRRTPSGVRAELTDPDGSPFDPTRAPDADVDAPLERRREGGMGIHLVRRMVDRVEFEHRDGSSTVTLTKRTE